MGPNLEFVDDTGVLFEGRRWTFFSGNDYHRFSRHPEIAKAVSDTVVHCGFNTAGSRITTANHVLYTELEHKLATLLGAEATLICSAGYLSSTILLQGVAAEFDRILIDETAHTSLVDAAWQSAKPIEPFRHSDALHVKNLLAGAPNSRPLLLTDGVFASVGDLAPLRAYAELLALHNGRMVIDDAHAVGVIGRTGKGSWEEAGISAQAIYQTGTMSKGLGGFGGFVSGSQFEIDAIRARSGAFKGGTPVPLPVAAASIRAIELLTAVPEKISRLRAVTELVKPRLKELGFGIAEGPAPILSVTYLDPTKNGVLEGCLRDHGIFPSFINYPGSPPGGHFRFTLSSAHSNEEIERLCSAIEASTAICGVMRRTR